MNIWRSARLLFRSLELVIFDSFSVDLLRALLSSTFVILQY